MTWKDGYEKILCSDLNIAQNKNTLKVGKSKEEAETRVSEHLLELLISLVCLHAQGGLVKQDKII